MNRLALRKNEFENSGLFNYLNCKTKPEWRDKQDDI